jgi:hypothetical protein
MASRHLKQNPKSRLSALTIVTFVVLAFAVVSAAMVVHVVSGKPSATQAPLATPVQQDISQEGRLVAVSPTSVTAESVDGYARTYVIDAQTNAITDKGSLIGGAGTAFAVNDEVAIVGVVRNGTAVATAVAQKQVSDLNGPPMDGV